MKRTLLYTSLSTILLLLSGCGSGGSDGGNSNTQTAAHSSYISDSRIAGITYKCASLQGTTDKEGKFQYNNQCNKVEFSVGDIFLGSIATADLIDGAVFYPSDLFGLDRNNTSNTQLTNTLQLLQSLDSDNNPNNGITIDTNTSASFAGTTLNLENNATTIADINATLAANNIALVNRNNAVAHYEDTLRHDLNISIDTVPPAPAIAINIPAETYFNTTSLLINGERGAKVFVNGIDTNISIDQNNSATIPLPTSGSDANISSVITLMDDTNASSSPLTVTIFRPSLNTIDSREVSSIKDALQNSTNPRIFSYTKQYPVASDYNITFSEPMRSPTVEDQNYTVTASIAEGSASDSMTFNEFVPFSQNLRDINETLSLKNTLQSRNYQYTRKWPTGDDMNVTFSEPMQSPTVENQTYDVTATIKKGNATQTTTFSESVPFSQALRDIAEIATVKNGLTSTTNPRNYTSTPLWNTGTPLSLSFSEAPRGATTEDQSYPVTVTVSKGSASDTYTFTETIPFSQALRDDAEVNTALTQFTNASDPRSYTYTNRWATTGNYTITFSEPRRTPTAIDQSYSVTITITIGNVTRSATFTEFVPTTNVNITLGDGTTTLINDEYKDQYTVTNGGIFQKIGQESKFIGTSFSIDPSTLPTTISSASDLLNYITTQSGTGLSAISQNNALDGSLTARYEISNQSQTLYQLLENLIGSVNVSVLGTIDYNLYTPVQNVVIDFYVEYDSINKAYVIMVLTDKTLDAQSDITKIVNKDSIVQANETIVNETETFTIANNSNKGDFLFVMDDSGSMSEEQSAAIAAIERTFSAAVVKYNLNWKATVVGTSYDNTYDSLMSNPSENNISKLTQQLNLGTSGSGDERGLKRAYYALSNNYVIPRANSSMSVIYTSDEVEHSLLSEFGETDTDFTNSYFAQNGITYDVIIPTSFTTANDYATKMNIATEGSRANLTNYDSGYDQMMYDVVRKAMAKNSSVKLQYPALASSITVFVDGNKVTTWEYDPSENAIVFPASSMPAVGATVEVVYSHLDYTQMIADAISTFNALPDDQKRAYTNNSLDVTFNPVSPATPLDNSDQTYPVTVTFSKLGYSDTTTFQETVLSNANKIADVIAEFDALPNDQKRSYVNNDVNITFDPTAPLAPVENRTQTYDVNVTFNIGTVSNTTTFQETVQAAKFHIVSNTDWAQSSTTFTSQNHADSSTSTLEFTILADTTMDYNVSSESGYDKLDISINGTSAGSFSGTQSGTLNVVTDDNVTVTYSKDGSGSSGTDNGTITIH